MTEITENCIRLQKSFPNFLHSSHALRCVGHLVELAQPEAYDAKYSKWAYADLPIFPMNWQYEVSAGTKKQFGILKKLMAREDVASLVCATDAGREGELIFRLMYHKAGCRKPFERLWISSMEDVAIKEGFENLRSGTEYDALYEAALCRERADWIVGLNATRLFSTLYGQTLNVGRVMTPTLAMVVMRESAMTLNEELLRLRQQVKELEKEIRLLKKENDFLEEASAFFAASRLKSAKTKE